jgi:hypothetical protein
VVGGGAPVHNGTVVTFTTSLGRIEPSEARTTGGKATVRLVGDGRSGTATVTAFSGSASESIELPVGAAAAERISVTASPQSLPGTGGSALISARVEDASGNGLPGVPVAFSTTRGNLSETSVRANSEGVAATTLTTTQEADVTASSGSKTGTVKLTLRPRSGVQMTPPASATVGVPSTLTVTPVANSVLSAVSIDFGDGRTVELGALTGATTVAHVFRSQGIASITARATDVDGVVTTTSTQVAVAPLAVSLAGSPATANARATVTFTATVSTGALIDRYDWNFGDGTTHSSTTNQVAKAFPSAGNYPVTVRVIPFQNGAASSAIITYVVTP